MYWTDDPVRDAQNYDMRMHRERERCCRGRCTHCGEDVYEWEDFYDIDGILLHEECLPDWAAQYKN